MIIGEKSSVDKNKQAVGYPIDWLKHAKVSFLMSSIFIFLFPIPRQFDLFSVGTTPE